MSEQDTSSDQHQETSETKKEPDKTSWKAFGLRLTISVVAVLIAVCIAPHIHFDDEGAARFGLAAATLTLFIFIDLLIYLFAYKEELSGFIFKIINTIKIFILKVWQKINSIKKFLKVFSIFIGVLLLIAAEIFLIHKTYEGFSNHAAEIRNLPDGFNFSLKSDELSKIQDIRFDTFLHAIGVLLLPALPALFFTKEIKSTLEKHILRTFVLTVIIGGLLAFLIPTFLYNYGFIGETKDLTTALLGLTGGVVALFSLIKSHQKSELEREQLEVQKQKDARDHTRQVHAARRERYIEAVGQLSGEKATVRLGGAYSLVNLVDEWLSDTSIKEKKRAKEAQAIIDHLCAYIRSPFALLELYLVLNKSTGPKIKKYGIENILKDKSEFYGEKNVRQTILHEIKSRLSSGDTKAQEGPWSNFIYDFSGAYIFYQFDLSNSFLCADSKFSGINFLYEAKFNNTTFKKTADFSNTVFYGSAKFVNTTFEDIAYFWKAKFKELANFEGTQFKSPEGTQNTNGILPNDSRYLQFKSSADFRKAFFGKIAKFGRAKFYGSADFRETLFETKAPFFHTLGHPGISAEFSQNSGADDYKFRELDKNSYTIAIEIKIHKIEIKMPRGGYLPSETHFELPTGCKLFDPSS